MKHTSGYQTYLDLQNEIESDQWLTISCQDSEQESYFNGYHEVYDYEIHVMGETKNGVDSIEIHEVELTADEINSILYGEELAQ